MMSLCRRCWKYQSLQEHSPGQRGDGIKQSEQTSPHTKYPERDKTAAPACQVTTGKGGEHEEQTRGSSTWQTWSVLARLWSRDAVAVHGVHLDLVSWEAMVTQRARHTGSSCRAALRHSLASIFISTNLRKKKKN